MAKHRVKGYTMRRGGKTIRVRGHLSKNPRKSK